MKTCVVFSSLLICRIEIVTYIKIIIFFSSCNKLALQVQMSDNFFLSE